MLRSLPQLYNMPILKVFQTFSHVFRYRGLFLLPTSKSSQELVLVLLIGILPPKEKRLLENRVPELIKRRTCAVLLHTHVHAHTHPPPQISIFS